MSNTPIIKFKDTILSGQYDFDLIALEIFNFQYKNNTIYKNYIDSLDIPTQNINSIKEIPFLPIEFFKTHQIKSTTFLTEKVYKSSGTGLTGRSMHHMIDNHFYLSLARSTFEHFYSPLEEYIVAAVLPSYQEQGDSSLIAMTDYFIQATKNQLSGYYLESLDDINKLLLKAKESRKKILFIGVTYALLNMAQKGLVIGNKHIVMETGGMKGRGKELIREELHAILKQGLGVEHIHSEYGMTELTSQAYSKGEGIFNLPSSMRILARDINDPFNYVSEGKTGGANIIDLGNFSTCSFIETKDMVRLKSDGFEILGRFDNSDLRGCNLLLV